MVGQFVTRLEHLVGGRVLAVDGHHERQALGEVPELLDGVVHASAVGEVELDLPGACALAQHREEADGDAHAGS